MNSKKPALVGAIGLYLLLALIVRYNPDIVNVSSAAGALTGGIIGYVIGKRQK